MHGNDDHLPLDFSIQRKDPTLTLPCSSDGYDPRPLTEKRLDMGYVLTNAHVPALGDHAGRSIPAPIATPWSPKLKGVQEHSPGLQGNKRCGRHNPMQRPVHNRSSRKSNPVSPPIPGNNVLSHMQHSAVSTSNEICPADISLLKERSPLQSVAIPPNQGFSSMQSTAIPMIHLYNPLPPTVIPASNGLGIYSMVSSINGPSLDHHYKPAAMPVTNSTADRKTVKVRPFKAFDVSAEMDYDKDTAPRLMALPVQQNGTMFLGSSTARTPDGVKSSWQPVESTWYRNSSSPKSGPVVNGHSPNESMDNTSRRTESSPRTDPSDSGVVGSTQVEEIVQNSGSPNNTVQNSGSPDNTVQNSGSPDNTVQNSGSPDNTVQNSGSPNNTVQNSGSPKKKVTSRRKGQPVPEDQKNEVYHIKRDKNNKAAKKSRDARRDKEDQVAIIAEERKVRIQFLEAQLAEEQEKMRNLVVQYQILERRAFFDRSSRIYQIQRMEEVCLRCENCVHAISEIKEYQPILG